MRLGICSSAEAKWFLDSTLETFFWGGAAFVNIYIYIYIL